MKNYLLLLLALSAVACSTATENIKTDYSKIITKFSDGDVEYSGFHNTFKYRATLMNTKVQTAYINHKAAVYKWDDTKKQLFGARDRFGIKPFHYYIDDEKCV